MRIRHFIPLLIGVPALFGFLADQTGGVVPPAPIVAIAATGMLLLLFQVEDHKASRFLGDLFHAFREAAHHHK